MLQAPYGNQHSLVLAQSFPLAQKPRHQQVLQVLLTADELAAFAAFLAGKGGAQ